MSSPSSISRVVVRAPNWLGDAVLSLPAIAAIRRHFPHAHLAVAAPAGVAALFREETSARPDAVVEVSDAARAVVATLEGGGYDLGILLPNSFRSAWLMRRARIPARWGYPTSMRGWLLTQRSAPPRQTGVQHQSDYYRALVRGLSIDCDDAAPAIAVSQPSAERATALLIQHKVDPGAVLVGFAPGAAYGQAKQWPIDRVASVAARLVREHDSTCLLLGASHDRPAARAIESWLQANAPAEARRVVDLVGRTSLGALAGIAARCRVFVSNDSGAMHLAAAIGRPVVAIFGPTDERATRPLGRHDVITEPVFCRPCLLRDCPIDHRCMKRITADIVFDAISKRLASAAAS